MHRARGELRDDLGGRDEGHLDAGQTRERAAIVARAAPLRAIRARRGRRIPSACSCSRPLEGTARTKGGSAGRLRVNPIRTLQAGDRARSPRRRRECPAAAPSVRADRRSGRRRRGGPGVRPRGVASLEHEAGVIIEVADEGGAEPGRGEVHPARGDEAVAQLEGVERGAEIELRRLGQPRAASPTRRPDRRRWRDSASRIWRFSAATGSP